MNIRNLADIFSIIAVLCRAAGQVTFSGNFFAAKDEPFIVTTSKNGSPITLKDGTKAGYFHLAFDYQLTDGKTNAKVANRSVIKVWVSGKTLENLLTRANRNSLIDVTGSLRANLYDGMLSFETNATQVGFNINDSRLPDASLPNPAQAAVNQAVGTPPGLDMTALIQQVAVAMAAQQASASPEVTQAPVSLPSPEDEVNPPETSPSDVPFEGVS